ncbi:hypothetical protein Glove_229g149 [Diversispora epigaea]|uniref:Uncharacterized protein n=1 Tax=Diversispora epigaea TaxID=1348612 RepID=A0A397IKP0_9GLOM|nr:hypothetical protein Glove_229g149 [Diversispora epigaea]
MKVFSTNNLCKYYVYVGEDINNFSENINNAFDLVINQCIDYVSSNDTNSKLLVDNIRKIDQFSICEIGYSIFNIISTKIENSNNTNISENIPNFDITTKQIENSSNFISDLYICQEKYNQCSASSIFPKTNSNNIHIIQNKDVPVFDNVLAQMYRLTLNFDIHQKSKTQCFTSPIYIEFKLLKDKEINNFLNLMYKENKLFLESSERNYVRIVNIKEGFAINYSFIIKLVHLFEKTSLLDDNLSGNQRNNKRTYNLANKRIYDKMLQYLSGISCINLRKRTQRTKSIYKLFSAIEKDKIKQIKSYSVNKFSKLTNTQIDIIKKYFINTEVSSRNQKSHIHITKSDNINISVEVSKLKTPVLSIQSSYTSNYFVTTSGNLENKISNISVLSSHKVFVSCNLETISEESIKIQASIFYENVNDNENNDENFSNNKSFCDFSDDNNKDYYYTCSQN